MHMLSRKDLKSAELETVRVFFSKSGNSCYSQRRSANKRRSDSVCQRIGFIRDSNASRRYTGRSFTRKTLPRSRIFLRVNHWPDTTTHQRRIKCCTANYVPIVVPGLSTSSSSSATRTSPTSVLQDAEHPASTRSESSISTVWVSPSHEPPEIEK